MGIVDWKRGPVLMQVKVLDALKIDCIREHLPCFTKTFLFGCSSSFCLVLKVCHHGPLLVHGYRVRLQVVLYRVLRLADPCPPRLLFDLMNC